MRHAAARLLAVLSLSAFVVASCAHFNSPTGFVQCMENSKDEKAAQDMVFALLDRDQTAALEAAIAAAPDVVKCLLQKAASLKGAGPEGTSRARKAREFLDGHGLSSIFKMGGGVKPAARVGALPTEGPAAGTLPVAPGSDGPGVLLAGICPWGTCVDGRGASGG